MTKLKAFAIHFGISFIIFSVILALIVFSWYPPPFFSADGGWQGIRIIAGVDLVLGPLLTLIVYKKGKPRLAMDMSLIALVQLSALIWGVWTVYTQRPVAAIFSENRFTAIDASTFAKLGYEKSMLLQFGPALPVWIYSKLPDDINEAQKIRVQSFRDKKPVHLFTEYYLPMHTTDNRAAILAKKLDMTKWIARNDSYKKEYDRFMAEHTQSADKIAFYSWKARYGRKVIALSQDDLSYIGILDINLPIEAEF